MDARTVLVVHLVKLVNKTDALISKDQRASLQRPLSRDWVAAHRRRQTDGRCALARGENGAVGRLLHVLEKLGLGRAWVAKRQDINITTDAVLLAGVFGNASKHGESYRRFDVFVSINGRSNAANDPLADGLIGGGSFYLADVVIGQAVL
jgi:hypothetical protein